MKTKNLIKKTFKKSSKFLKLKSYKNLTHSILSQKNFRLTAKQILAIDQKIVRSFKNQKIESLVFAHLWVTSRALGSKMGSGKGKPKHQIMKIRKYQHLLRLKNTNKKNQLK